MTAAARDRMGIGPDAQETRQAAAARDRVGVGPHAQERN
jgi:hypothetical protein